MSEEFKKRKLVLEQDCASSQSYPLTNMVYDVEQEIVYMKNHIEKLYPQLVYGLVNYGTKYDIYEKEPEDLSYEYYLHQDLITGSYCYKDDFLDKYQGVPLIIDGNKLIIYKNWKKGINDEVNFLILNFQIDILIIRDNTWNKPVCQIPNRLSSLKIYSEIFNQSVNNLPLELKILCIKSCGYSDSTINFNKYVNNLPPKLEELVIYSNNFNRPVVFLPNALRKLFIGGKNSDFNQPVNYLPPNLHTLCICSEQFDQKINNLPDSLQILFIEYALDYPDYLDNLPEGLKILYYGFYSGTQVDYSINNLPNGILEIHLGSSFNNSIDNLPDSVEQLYIGDESCNFNTVINKLPAHLQILYITYITSSIDKTDSVFSLESISCNTTKNIFSEINIEKFKKVCVKHVEHIFNWNEIGYQLSCDI